MAWTTMPDNRLDRSQQTTGLFTLAADEVAAQVEDVEFDLTTYADGSITIDNRQDRDSYSQSRVRLSPSQVSRLRAVLMSDLMEKALNETMRKKGN